MKAMMAVETLFMTSRANSCPLNLSIWLALCLGSACFEPNLAQHCCSELSSVQLVSVGDAHKKAEKVQLVELPRHRAQQRQVKCSVFVVVVVVLFLIHCELFDLIH